MSLETAFRAIDHLARNSVRCDQVGITFYGGEPLLRFSTIKECVEYARRTVANKVITYSVTTNATLLTPEMAKYFANEGFGINVSIDGPEDIHDQYRKDSNGNGSFLKTLVGLRRVIEAYDDHKKVSLSMVYSPPFSEEKVNRIAQLWDVYPWLPKDISISISYAERSPVLNNASTQPRMDYSLLAWAKENYLGAYKKGEKAHIIASSLIERNLARLHQRPIFTEPLGKYHLNGCCIPASRRLYVCVDGTFFICERIGLSPEVGSVFNGVDLERVSSTYVDEYATRSLPTCAGCWALQLCSTCYAHSFQNGRFDLDYKGMSCWLQCNINEELLKLYCSLLETNENGLDHLMDWKIV
jgi:uncharacterized protein